MLAKENEGDDSRMVGAARVKIKMSMLNSIGSFDERVQIKTDAVVNASCDIMAGTKKFKFENGEVQEVANALGDTLNSGMPKIMALRHRSSSMLLPKNKRRLSCLLNKLVRKHKWKEACGVLSALLEGTCKERNSTKNRRKYWVAMELLSQINSSKNHSAKINRLYDIWITKQGPWDRVLNNKTYLIQLESALNHFTQGNIEGAFNLTRFLVQELESGSDPIVNLTHGMILYQLWYSSLPEELQLRGSETQCTSKTSWMDPSDHLYPKLGLVEYSEHHDSIDTQDVNCSKQFVSSSSIGNKKELIPKEKFHRVLPSGTFYLNQEISGHEPFSYHENIPSDFSIFHVSGLDTGLLPIRLQQPMEDGKYSVYSYRMLVNEYHKDAVKHLRLALHSTPPLLAALLPLVQLLLLSDKVQEALEELKMFSHESNNALSFRLRAHLLPSIFGDDSCELAECYVDILKRDPTSEDSILRLIRIHKHGNYKIEALVEMIALHLDATNPTCHSIWGELASCLFQIQNVLQYLYEEDQMSTERTAIGNSAKQACFVSSNAIPEPFSKRESRKSWKIRCRWWSTRHFSNDNYLSEMQAGNWELLTAKSACASHLYGPEFEYVTSVLDGLKKEEDENRILFLQRHIQNPMKLMEKLCSTR